MIFIWQYVGNVSDSWHDGGGLAVIAADLASARAALVPETEQDCEALSKAPDFSAEIVAEPQVFVFPDAGCC